MGCNAQNHPSSCDCGFGGDTGGGGWPQPPSPGTAPAVFGGWGLYETRRLESYTIPNARCPVCHDAVFFYQSEWGGRVFFNPPLGPPWPKHECTDNGPTPGGRRRPSGVNASLAADSPPSPAERRGSAPLDEPERLLLDDVQTREFTDKHVQVMQESGWHPLLNLKITDTGGHQAIKGFDPVDNRWCHIITKELSSELLTESRPTFICVFRPEATDCQIQQITIHESGIVESATAEAWNGVKSRVDVQLIKEAKSGNIESMRKLASDRTFLRFGSYISIDIERSYIESAKYWLSKAKEGGSLQARFEAAYLEDCEDRLVRKDKNTLFMDFDINEITDKIAGRKIAIENIVSGLSTMNMKFYRQNLMNIDRRLSELTGNGGTPKLKNELDDYLFANPGP